MAAACLLSRARWGSPIVPHRVNRGFHPVEKGIHLPDWRDLVNRRIRIRCASGDAQQGGNDKGTEHDGLGKL
jgi:hypothetical protein